MDDENELLGPPDDPEIEKNRILSIFGKILSNEPVQQLTAIDVQNVELAVSKKTLKINRNVKNCKKMDEKMKIQKNPEQNMIFFIFCVILLNLKQIIVKIDENS